MEYTAEDFSSLLGLPGFSDEALNTHFGLYKGYVANTNKVSQKLSEMLAADQNATPEYGELSRRFGWEFNGMRLHELHFGAMSKDGGKLEDQSDLSAKIEKQFGSLDAWRKDYTSKGAMRGIGWAILYHDPKSDRLFNVWIDEHALGHPAGLTPLLPMDVFEHAYMVDYGTKRAEYIEAFMNAVDWSVVASRLKV